MIVVAEFRGKFELAINNNTTSKIQSYIDRYEDIHLIELLGKELYDLFIANPADPEFLAISEPFTFQSDCGKVWQSQGMKSMLLGFVYFMYTRDNKTTQTTAGVVKLKADLSSVPSNMSTMNWQRYNESVDTYDAIQAYILDNESDYPTFKGVNKQYIIPNF